VWAPDRALLVGHIQQQNVGENKNRNVQTTTIKWRSKRKVSIETLGKYERNI
jgi:hypothetical protein